MTTTDETLTRARERLAALRALDFERALDVVDDLCLGRRKWVMSIPARPDDDPDLIIGRALGDANHALPALLDLADAVAKWRPAYDRSCCHDSAVERMDSRGEANRHLAAIDAALARLAGEG